MPEASNSSSATNSVSSGAEKLGASKTSALDDPNAALPRAPVDEEKPANDLPSIRSRTRSRRRSDVGSVLARHESVDDAASLASIDRPPSEDEQLPPAKIYAPLSFPVLVLLAPASIFGTLARLGLLAITTYDGRAVFPLAWVQAAGCLIMGFALEMREPFGQFYGPLYTALTTGFCGSLTTFSSWQLDVFESWVNNTAADRDWFRDAIDGVGKTVFTLAISLSAVSFGAHLASLLRPLIPRPSLPPPSIRYTLSALSVLTYAAAFPAYFRLPVRIRADAAAALLFAFPGALSRYLLSISLNKRLALFPLGTFAANTAGTAVIGAMEALQSVRGAPFSPASCALLKGVADGYCGCLTTVSTFAAEVDALDGRRAWIYVVISWVVSQALLAVVLGPTIGAGAVSRHVTCSYE